MYKEIALIDGRIGCDTAVLFGSSDSGSAHGNVESQADERQMEENLSLCYNEKARAETSTCFDRLETLFLRPFIVVMYV